MPYYIHKVHINLAPEVLENEILVAKYIENGFDVKDGVATKEEFKVQTIKEHIVKGLRPDVPQHLSPVQKEILKNIIIPCWYVASNLVTIL